MSNNFLVMKMDKATEKITNDFISAPIYRVGNKIEGCLTLESVKETIRNAPVINAVPTAKYGILETTNRESDYTSIDCSENIAVITFDVDKAYFSKPVDILGEDDNYYFVVDENDNEDMVRRIKKTMSYFIEVD